MPAIFRFWYTASFGYFKPANTPKCRNAFTTGIPTRRPRSQAWASLGRSMNDAYRPPSGEAQARPWRPRPAACRSAQTTRPSSTSDSRSSFAVSFVDSTASKWRIVRPTALRFASCTSPIFNNESDERGDISTCASGGRLRGGGPGSLGHILAPEEAFEHHGNPHEHADVERPGDIVPGQGAADGGDQGADSDPQVEHEARPPIRVRRDADQSDAPRDREQIGKRPYVVGQRHPRDRDRRSQGFRVDSRSRDRRREPDGDDQGVEGEPNAGAPVHQEHRADSQDRDEEGCEDVVGFVHADGPSVRLRQELRERRDRIQP